jgi:hypothetical protein
VNAAKGRLAWRAFNITVDDDYITTSRRILFLPRLTTKPEASMTKLSSSVVKPVSLQKLEG